MANTQTAKSPAARKAPARKVGAMNRATDVKKQEEITEEQRLAEAKQDERSGEDRRKSVDTMAFAVQQLSTPAGSPIDMDAFNAEVAKVAQKHGVPVSVAVPSNGKVTQNGVTRPKPDTLCGRIWHAADSITVKKGSAAAIAELKVHPDVEGVNAHTVKTQYARWRQFNNFSGRIEPAQTAESSGVVMDHDGAP